MKLAFKLAIRNLLGAGLRTWLNVIVLSFSFVVIIWMKGMLVGWDRQAKTDMEQWEIGNGQLWNENYDPYDIFTLDDSHTALSKELQEKVKQQELVPVLITQGTIYPAGRMQPILIKGITPQQSLLQLPTSGLSAEGDAIPVIIGASMSRSTNLKIGDRTTLRWRDANGTFDATEIEVVDVFATNVPSVDVGQVWMDISTLQQIAGLENEVTLLVMNTPLETSEAPFVLKTKAELTSEIDEMIAMKNKGQSVFYIVLLLLAMLAIFDTQVLSIFKRQKEIGTYIALGYTRKEVVQLFTIEGAMHAVLAALTAAAYGIPFFIWQARNGFTMPVDSSDMGMTMAQTMFPYYSGGLILGTIVVVFLTTTVVSYWPSRKIAKMNPTQALRGKIQ